MQGVCCPSSLSCAPIAQGDRLLPRRAILPPASTTRIARRRLVCSLEECSQDPAASEIPRPSLHSLSPSGSRREALALASASMLSALLPTAPAHALGAPVGYAALEDPQDRYRFFYPFGWQEVLVKGQDKVFKDVIEPLESVAVNVINTDKKDVRELGSAADVAQVLVERVLTGPTQKARVLKAEEKEADGKVYYTFEFEAAAPSYKRHALGVVSVANGKFYTLTTGSNERRWSKVEEKLRAVVNSFETI